VVRFHLCLTVVSTSGNGGSKLDGCFRRPSLSQQVEPTLGMRFGSGRSRHGYL